MIGMEKSTSRHGNAFRTTGPLWGDTPAAGGSPYKGSVMQSFDIFCCEPDQAVE